MESVMMTTPVGGTRLRSRIRSAANLFTKKRFPNSRITNHLNLHQQRNGVLKNHQKCYYSLRNNHQKSTTIANNNCINDNATSCVILSERRGSNSGECCNNDNIPRNINERYKGPFAR
ncbi:hypothetical protein Trydic_g6362 [Trypoxylus dichotomus]